MTDSGTLEVVDLASLFADEPRCQYKHVTSRCSTKVTARVHSACDDQTYLICASGARITADQIKRDVTCSACRRGASECWSLYPA